MASLPNPLPQIAADPTGTTLGLRLPPGGLVDTTADGPSDQPLLWIADSPAGPRSWAGVLPARRHGLLPVLLADRAGGSGVRTLGHLRPRMMSHPGNHDAEEVLAGFWEAYAAEEADEDTPPAWHGLATPALTPACDPDADAEELSEYVTGADGVAWLPHARIALVPARRSADIPAAIGWTGPLNHENDVARLCAVMRSWEDRFGVRLVALGFDTMLLSVAAPPTTRTAAEQLAAEHYAFCPDTIDQSGPATTPETYAVELLTARTWSFWWD
ncbi:DUF4253 domain-containing protein [Streptomyces sp. NPDC050418]|uniref:DUF4253 domain-containing protein n=1 Tax=Streptomyces sp. NPDC050418 TaxID=3365612 RepID=UPI00379DE164